MIGRKPKPTALHALHGNPSKLGKPAIRARRAVEPPPPDTGGLEPTDDLTPSQRAIWADAVANAPPGVLRRIDLMALRVWVIACDFHHQACVSQSRTSLLVQYKAKDGTLSQPQQSPLLAIINRQGVMMLRAAEQLGFTPVARPRLFSSSASMPVGLPSKDGAAESIDDYLANAPARPTLQ